MESRSVGGRGDALIGLDGSSGDDRPGETGLDEASAGVGHLGSQLGISDDSQQCGGNCPWIQFSDDTGAGFSQFGEMALLRCDHGKSRGKSLGDGHAETFLAARQAEAGGRGQGRELFGPIQRPNKVDTVGQAVLRYPMLKTPLGAVIGTCDDQMNSRVLCGNKGERVGEVVEALFGVQTGEKEDVGLVGQFGVCLVKEALWRQGFESLQGNAVGDDLQRAAQTQSA